MSKDSGTDKRYRLRQGLSVPAIAAPMFLVSGPDLVIEACRSGIIGSFPSLNARTPDELDRWFARIAEETVGYAPYAVNLILDRRNPRRDEDFALILRHKPPVVITSVGSPETVVAPIHDYGGIVFSDVATMRHATKAIAAGADGLVLLTAGAGGNTGWLNPFAFTAAVRAIFDGPLAIAGCVTHGAELAALELLGADFGYMGTRFLASNESLAPREHKDAVVAATADDIILTDRISGMPANFVRARLVEAGVMDARGEILSTPAEDYYSFANVWSAGQAAGSIERLEPVAQIVRRLVSEYHAARSGHP
ncbi:NAD(P)H-dependent flavin oxidoreductase [Sphingobium fluviale]|uniref:Nitronate monooxygenase n=1 Tax=Sphingobium fluviale TaxID=2506423 RepID=A0A4Q1KJX6_9SPHN|nr:nitronate monooxygenase [Sphingobium fluviale]RXR29509.1 nitronate monooxygenase [Sphingobium fluviale]